MSKRDIVTRFLKEGYQLDGSAIEYFISNPEKTDEFIQALQSAPKTTPTITLGLVKDVLGEGPPTIKIIKKFFINHENEKTPISEYSNKLINYYEKKKEVLINKVDSTKLLSINKIQKQKEFVLIGMVREKDRFEKSIVIEDLTGSTVVYFENIDEFESVFENDVIALICEVAAGGIKGKKAIWPDLPLKRTANKTKENIYCVFISDFHMDSDGFNKEGYERFVKWIENVGKKTSYKKIYVVILGKISHKSTDVERLFNILPKNAFKIFLKSKKDAAVDERGHLLTSTVPMMIDIEGIKFLLCQGHALRQYKQFWKGGSIEVMKNILRRRELLPFVGGGETPILLKNTTIDTVPDIFVVGSFDTPAARNYKGVTLITTGSLADNPIFWAVNLRTREINKVDLS